MLHMRTQFSQEDRVVVVMGPTGAGKSTFIEHATRQDGRTIGHKLRSFTTAIRTVRYTHPVDGYPVLFVDTPGFDDTDKSDLEILTIIADWLVKTYKGNVNLATIIYVHSISDARMTGSHLKNLELFASLCGHKAMPHVIFATTKWSHVSPEDGASREEELKREFWKDMLNSGCSTKRFENTYESAWRIIGCLSRKNRAHVLLPMEIVENKLRLNETAAGIALNKELERLIKDRKDAARLLQMRMANQDNEFVVQQLNERVEKIEGEIRETADQLLAMRIPLSRKIRLFFKKRPSY